MVRRVDSGRESGEADAEARIRDRWLDPTQPGSLGSVQALHDNWPTDVPRPSHRRLREALSGVPAFVQMRRTLPKVAGRATDYDSIGATMHWQLDTAYMPPDRGYGHFLIAVDVFTNYLVVEPLRSAGGAEARRVVDDWIRAGRLPVDAREGATTFFTDRGSEFVANRAHWLQTWNIRLEFMKGPQKAFKAETFIRVIKHRLYRWMRAQHSVAWTDVLQDVVRAQNAAPARYLSGLKPADVETHVMDGVTREGRDRAVGTLSERDARQPSERNDLAPDEWVMIQDTEDRTKRYKGYDLHRRRLYRVARIDKTRRPWLYWLKQGDGAAVRDRVYYRYELHPVARPRTMRVPREAFRSARERLVRKTPSASPETWEVVREHLKEPRKFTKQLLARRRSSPQSDA